MKPKVTILITSYNELTFLPQAIDSCKSQSYDNIEILIGDDGSDDGSIDYIRSLGNSINYFIMPRDNGPVIPSVRVSNVIRRGLDEAKGEYFLALSADDYLLDPNFISRAINFLDTNNEYSAYINGFQKVDETGNIIEEFLSIQQSSIKYWSGDYIHVSCFVFRKIRSADLLNRMNDDTGLEYVLANKGKWKYEAIPVLAYRQRAKSIQHEVDIIELSILEIMLFQDVLNYSNNSMFRNATLSRFYKPVSYLIKHRNELSDEKYGKYLSNCSKYDNNVLKTIADGKFKKSKLIIMFLMYLFYKINRKLQRLINSGDA